MIRQHEVLAGACKHCGAVNVGPDLTCILREGNAPARDTGPRTRAADDYDTISARMAELAAEKAAAMNKETA